jgi:hypothetical protein
VCEHREKRTVVRPPSGAATSLPARIAGENVGRTRQSAEARPLPRRERATPHVPSVLLHECARGNELGLLGVRLDVGLETLRVRNLGLGGHVDLPEPLLGVLTEPDVGLIDRPAARLGPVRPSSSRPGW